jgi:hypothetical protein
MSFKISIKKNNGFWTVNNKKLSECNFIEYDFFNKFILELKIKNQNCRVKNKL